MFIYRVVKTYANCLYTFITDSNLQSLKPIIKIDNTNYNIDYLITVAPLKGWDILRQQANCQFSKLMCWKQEKWASIRI